jgi:hypothetical protein
MVYMIGKTSIFISLVFFVIGCSGDKKIAEPEPINLTGTWEEIYTHIYWPPAVIPEGESVEYEISLISQITFSEDTFYIAVCKESDCEATRTSFYSGKYSVSGDTVSFIVRNDGDSSRIYYYRFSTSGNTLDLCEIPLDMGNGLFAISIIGIPWQHGDLWLAVRPKTCGTFTRISE